MSATYAKGSAEASSSWSAGPLRARSGSQTEGRISPPQRVSGLSHDSMCGRPWSPLCWDVSSVVLVWSLFFQFFLFELARRCYCCLFRWSACLLISSFFLRLLFLQRRVSPQMLQTRTLTSLHLTSLLTPSLFSSLPHTHIPTYSTQPRPKKNLTSHPTPPLSLLCRQCVASVADWLSCFLAVTESQWTGKERWQ